MDQITQIADISNWFISIYFIFTEKQAIFIYVNHG